jgi:hypothetical protein
VARAPGQVLERRRGRLGARASTSSP